MISDLETLVLGNARSPEHLDLVVHIDVCIVFSYDNDTAAVPILYNYSQVFQVLWDFSWILHSVTTSWCQVVQDDAWGGSNKKMDVLNDWYEACCIVKQPIELKVGTLDTYRGGSKILGWFPFERGVAFLLLHRTHVSLSIMSSRIWVLHAKKRSKIDQEVKKRGRNGGTTATTRDDPIMEKNLRYSQGTDKTALCSRRSAAMSKYPNWHPWSTMTIFP